MKHIAARILVAIFALASTGVAFADVCSTDGAGQNCELIITINSLTSVSITAGSSSSFYNDHDNDDTLVGIINDSGKTISSLTLSSLLDIFAFDGDGVDTQTGAKNNSHDTSGYGGPITYFGTAHAVTTGPWYDQVTTYSDTVNFAGNLAAAVGTSTYFSLEDALTFQSCTGYGRDQTCRNVLDDAGLAVSNVIDPPAVPEPKSLALLGLGLLGLIVVRRQVWK